MRFYIDENYVVQVVRPARQIFRLHEFVTTNDANLSGTLDRDLFPRLREMGVHAIITYDKKQLVDMDEARGLYENDLHWIGMKPIPQQVKGVGRVALQTASLIAALPLIIDAWQDSPHVYKIKAVERGAGQRFTAHPIRPEMV